MSAAVTGAGTVDQSGSRPGTLLQVVAEDFRAPLRSGPNNFPRLQCGNPITDHPSAGETASATREGMQAYKRRVLDHQKPEFRPFAPLSHLRNLRNLWTAPENSIRRFRRERR